MTQNRTQNSSNHAPRNFNIAVFRASKIFGMRITAVFLITGLTSAPPARADVVPAWTASQQRVWGREFLFPTNIPATLANRTLRQIVRVGIGGRSVRIVLANSFGVRPIAISGAHVARSSGGSGIGQGGSALHFGGKTATIIAPGATIVSDPVTLAIPPGTDLAVSIYFDEAPSIQSFHWDGRRTAYISIGDQSAAATPSIIGTTTARLLLAGVLVDAPVTRGTVVVMGDSITDGAGATLDAELRWPDQLAARAAHRNISVVNAGISGARLLSDGMGSKALARFDRDVLAQPGVKTLILMLGINDIAWPGTPFAPSGPAATFEALTAGYRAVVDRAHAAGVRVVGATLTPFADALPGTPLGATYFTLTKDALRRRVNDWIRTSGTFDEVLDADRLLADTKTPGFLAKAYDSGDHLHPGDAGNKVMADAVELDTLIGR